MDTPENKPPILHILVVGFHHKLGCQVEFSYPPLIAGTSGKSECPSGWKYLPTLALPDGSHNFAEDTVFFNLPSLTDPVESVFGVSCYRQIPVEKLKIRTADVTRSTVQKSVCVLARLPIYGYIEVKLSLIADTFFDNGDFSCTELLVKAYRQLNACLTEDESRRTLRHHFHVGLPLREIVLHWRHKTLMLVKLFLLQRRVVCFGSPVRQMCVLILGIASLMPRLLERGFQEVACVRTSRPLSPMPDFTDALQRERREAQECASGGEQKQPLSSSTPLSEQESAALMEVPLQKESSPSPETASCLEAAADEDAMISLAFSAASEEEAHTPAAMTPPSQASMLSTEAGTATSDDSQRSTERSSSLTGDGSSTEALASSFLALIGINPDDYRAPITIFASGNLCLPYLSLPYMDLLSDPSVLSYVIGTSNVLFQQKRQLADVLVDIENGNIETQDAELRKQLVLSTEDLRFVDYLLKHVQAPKEDAEGSEQWIREQFQGYLLALLRAAVSQDSTAKDCEYFNGHYMSAFKKTQCFQEWYDVRPDADFFAVLPTGHPFAGTLSVTDMKLKIAQTMQNSESGRKLNQAVNNTSRAVGGAISQAKGAFSNWWSTFTAPTATAQANTTDNTIQETAEDVAQPIVVATFQKCQRPTENVGETVKKGMEQEKSIGTDSAEELEEDADAISEEAIKEQDADLHKTPEAEIAASTEESTMTVIAESQSNISGIIEIGHEAVSLDKSSPKQSVNEEENAKARKNISTGITELEESIEHQGDGRVFIV